MEERLRRFRLLAALMMAKPDPAGSLVERLRQRMAARRGSLDDGSDSDTAEAEGSFRLPPGATIERDVSYGADPAQRLDVYYPAGASGAPVILYVHGGGWRRGDKAMPQMVRNKVPHWVGKGMVFVSTNYRMLPAANVLEQAQDVGRALAFVQSRAGGWGGDSARVIVMGHSAGAHLASLMTADASLVRRHGVQRWLATVAIDSAAFNMETIMQRPHYRFYDPVFGTDPSFWREASPTYRLKAEPAAPMLLVCSSQREDSGPPAREFAAKATAFGGHVTVLSIDLNHMQINDLLGVRGGYTEAVDAFLKSVGAL